MSTPATSSDAERYEKALARVERMASILIILAIAALLLVLL